VLTVVVAGVTTTVATVDPKSTLRVAVPFTEPAVAVIVVAPWPVAVASPVPSIVATAGVPLAHVNATPGMTAPW